LALTNLLQQLAYSLAPTVWVSRYW